MAGDLHQSSSASSGTSCNNTKPVPSSYTRQPNQSTGTFPSIRSPQIVDSLVSQVLSLRGFDATTPADARERDELAEALETAARFGLSRRQFSQALTQPHLFFRHFLEKQNEHGPSSSSGGVSLSVELNRSAFSSPERDTLSWRVWRENSEDLGLLRAVVSAHAWEVVDRIFPPSGASRSEGKGSRGGRRTESDFRLREILVSLLCQTCEALTDTQEEGGEFPAWVTVVRGSAADPACEGDPESPVVLFCNTETGLVSPEFPNAAAARFFVLFRESLMRRLGETCDPSSEVWNVLSRVTEEELRAESARKCAEWEGPLFSSEFSSDRIFFNATKETISRGDPREEIGRVSAVAVSLIPLAVSFDGRMEGAGREEREGCWDFLTGDHGAVSESRQKEMPRGFSGGEERRANCMGRLARGGTGREGHDTRRRGGDGRRPVDLSTTWGQPWRSNRSTRRDGQRLRLAPLRFSKFLAGASERNLALLRGESSSSGYSSSYSQDSLSASRSVSPEGHREFLRFSTQQLLSEDSIRDAALRLQVEEECRREEKKRKEDQRTLQLVERKLSRTVQESGTLSPSPKRHDQSPEWCSEGYDSLGESSLRRPAPQAAGKGGRVTFSHQIPQRGRGRGRGRGRRQERRILGGPPDSHFLLEASFIPHSVTSVSDPPTSPRTPTSPPCLALTDRDQEGPGDQGGHAGAQEDRDKSAGPCASAVVNSTKEESPLPQKKTTKGSKGPRRSSSVPLRASVSVSLSPRRKGQLVRARWARLSMALEEGRKRTPFFHTHSPDPHSNCTHPPIGPAGGFAPFVSPLAPPSPLPNTTAYLPRAQQGPRRGRKGIARGRPRPSGGAKELRQRSESLPSLHPAPPPGVEGKYVPAPLSTCAEDTAAVSLSVGGRGSLEKKEREEGEDSRKRRRQQREAVQRLHNQFPRAVQGALLLKSTAAPSLQERSLPSVQLPSLQQSGIQTQSPSVEHEKEHHPLVLSISHCEAGSRTKEKEGPGEKLKRGAAPCKSKAFQHPGPHGRSLSTPHLLNQAGAALLPFVPKKLGGGRQPGQLSPLRPVLEERASLKGSYCGRVGGVLSPSVQGAGKGAGAHMQRQRRDTKGKGKGKGEKKGVTVPQKDRGKETVMIQGDPEGTQGKVQRKERGTVERTSVCVNKEKEKEPYWAFSPHSVEYERHLLSVYTGASASSASD
uniref:Uncharacterized protein n=1 Tax=Chromera velia CCMP2878 TaxID=1169474 RepID=A0A0G4GH44_9ALVE|eukprot:Cvel_4695.t1-p1 / transcript=Cvel_4695.t1 / gene=Cvel_4695 / organism=Chromera_velia_CCMP2878 / gene_product=hypothetical protein / transcript_product=hypothetical protein / location=Cvel_scaffold208:104131-109258(-) / protein_length=1188 / sequence_SO=supercontig / SO=protein_coding / is_pseudo=false